MQNHPPLNQDKKIFVVSLFVCTIALLSAMVILSTFKKTDIFLVLNDFWRMQLIPNKNTCEFQNVSQLNYLLVYYSALFLLILPVLKQALDRYFLGKQLQPNDLKIQVMILLTILIASQTISHGNYFKTEANKFFNKSVQQKISNNFEKSYAFAQYCKNHLQGKHVCQPITDTDLNPRGNLLTYLAVRYYLYPLDIVTYKAHKDFDCKIFFLKNEPKRYVPEDFTILSSFDAKSFIAIKNDKP